jgi:hypothetical protein
MSSHTVFVCSTYLDLIKEREAVLDGIRKLQLRHNSMEFFGARPAKPLEVCLSELRGSELVIVIIGQLYGSIEDTVGLSFSEAEYQEAFRLGKRCLVYFRDAEVLVPPAHVEQDVKKQELLSRFKETLVGRHTVAKFRDPHDLAVQVTADLGREIREPAGKTASRADRARSEVSVKVAKLPSVNPMLIGRDDVLAELDRAWLDPQTRVVSITAFGGSEKLPWPLTGGIAAALPARAGFSAGLPTRREPEKAATPPLSRYWTMPCAIGSGSKIRQRIPGNAVNSSRNWSPRKGHCSSWMAWNRSSLLPDRSMAISRTEGYSRY